MATFKLRHGSRCFINNFYQIDWIGKPLRDVMCRRQMAEKKFSFRFVSRRKRAARALLETEFCRNSGCL